MAEKSSKHVSRKGSNDKRGITVTLAETLIYPYVTNVKEALGLPETQKVLLVWDAFKADKVEIKS